MGGQPLWYYQLGSTFFIPDQLDFLPFSIKILMLYVPIWYVTTSLLILVAFLLVYTNSTNLVWRYHMSINLKIMGQRIRDVRRFRQITAEQLSDQIGMAVESLGHIECGNRRPSLTALYTISEILDVSLDYLTGRSDSPERRIIRSEAEAAGLTERQEKALHKMVQGLIPFVRESF